MRQLETQTNSGQDISNNLLIHTFTADRERLVFLRIFVQGVAGGGDYTAYLTIQRGGLGVEYYIVPLTVTPVDSGYTAIGLTTVAIPIDEDDVVRAYMRGLLADTVTTITTEVWEDDSNFYTVVPGSYPTGTLGSSLGRIGAEPTIRVQVPYMDPTRVRIVRGDDYVDEHNTGIVFSSQYWPVITGASVEFISEQLTVPCTILGPSEVMVELTSAQTTQLRSGYFSIIATFPDLAEVSLIPKQRVYVLDRVIRGA